MSLADAANDVDATYRVYAELSRLPAFATVPRDYYSFDMGTDKKRYYVNTQEAWKGAKVTYGFWVRLWIWKVKPPAIQVVPTLIVLAAMYKLYRHYRM